MVSSRVRTAAQHFNPVTDGASDRTRLGGPATKPKKKTKKSSPTTKAAKSVVRKRAPRAPKAPATEPPAKPPAIKPLPWKFKGTGQAKLTYFAGWGLAEQARWMMAASGVEFTQVVLTEFSQFDAMRESGDLLFRQLPLLELDGLNLVQSQSIVRYLARRGGLCGADSAEAALVDMLCEGIKDARGVVVGYAFSSDKTAHVESIEDKVFKCLTALEKTIVERKDGTVGVLASGTSAPDILVGELVEGLLPMKNDVVDKYPKVAKLHKQVLAMPGVAAYLASDKRYPFPSDGEIGDTYVAHVNTVLGKSPVPN